MADKVRQDARITVRIPRDLRERISLVAKAEERSFAAQIRLALRGHMEKEN